MHHGDKEKTQNNEKIDFSVIRKCLWIKNFKIELIGVEVPQE